MATAAIPAGGVSSAKLGAVTPRRRFRLLDAMILVAATALACGITLWFERVSNGYMSWSELFEIIGRNKDVTEVLREASSGLAFLISPFVAMWTLALVPIRLIGPRLSLSRLARQPGIIAAFAASLAIALAGIRLGVLALLGGWDYVQSPYGMMAVAWVPANSGLAVMVAWMTLLVGRRWRAEPGWVDRMGRALGVLWIVAALAESGSVFSFM